MIERDVTTIVQSVIADRGLPFVVLSVARVPAGWEVRAQRGGGVVSIVIPDGRPIDVRAATEEQLEDAL